jgi:hypothetical protein
MLERLSLPGSPLDEPPRGLAQFLEQQLEHGEVVVWRGQPILEKIPAVVRIGLRMGGAFVLCWCLLVLVLGTAGVGQEMRNKRFDGMAMFGAMTVAMLAAGLTVFHLIKRARRRLTEHHYVLTDRRALVIVPGSLRGYVARSFSPRDLSAMTRTESHSDGSGTLLFRTGEYRDGDNEKIKVEHGFHGIAQVEMVERLIREMVARTPG